MSSNIRKQSLKSIYMYWCFHSLLFLFIYTWRLNTGYIIFFEYGCIFNNSLLFKNTTMSQILIHLFCWNYYNSVYWTLTHNFLPYADRIPDKKKFKWLLFNDTTGFIGRCLEKWWLYFAKLDEVSIPVNSLMDTNLDFSTE